MSKPRQRRANVSTRHTVTVLAAFTVSMATLTGPATAATTSYEAADQLGLLPTLLLFVGGPIGLFLLIWLLVVAGRLARRPKTEDDMSWFREMADADEVEQSAPELSRPAPAGELTESEPARSEAVSEPSGSTRVTPTA